MYGSSMSFFVLLERLRQNKSCGCRFCSKPQPPAIPDAVSLIDEVLNGAKFKRSVPEPMKIPTNMVTIFDGPHARLYGILIEYCHRGCCALVLTKNGIVEIPVNHFIIHP
jgi:hypothetical protein